MPFIFDQAVLATCLALAPGTYNSACQKSLQAAGTQTQIKENANIVEERVTKKAYQYVEQGMGQNFTYLMGSSSLVYKAYKDKAITFKLPTMGTCSSIENKVSLSSYQINLKWNIK
jgi:hypothetical protein